MKSHCEILREMLLSQRYVKISEMRMWSNYRSRLSDLRKKYGMRIDHIMVDDAAGHKVHAYRYIPPMPAAQPDLFKTENHDGAVKEMVV